MSYSLWEIPGEHVWNGLRLTGSEKSCLTRASRFSKAPEGMRLNAQNEFIMSITVGTNICWRINSHGFSFEHLSAFMGYLPSFGMWDITKSLFRLWCEKINLACWYLLSKLAHFGFLRKLMVINQVNIWLHWQKRLSLPNFPMDYDSFDESILLHSVSNAWKLESNLIVCQCYVKSDSQIFLSAVFLWPVQYLFEVVYILIF